MLLLNQLSLSLSLSSLFLTFFFLFFLSLSLSYVSDAIGDHFDPCASLFSVGGLYTALMKKKGGETQELYAERKKKTKNDLATRVKRSPVTEPWFHARPSGFPLGVLARITLQITELIGLCCFLTIRHR